MPLPEKPHSVLPPTPDDALIDDLYITAHLLGIKPQDAKNAIERTPDKRELLRGWKRQHLNLTRGILAAHTKGLQKAVASEAEERHTELQREHAESRRAARARMTLGTRLDALRAEVVTEPGPGVAALGRTKIKGGEGDGTPPDPGEFVSSMGMGWNAHWLWFLRAMETLENDWDEFLGRGAAKSWTQATEEEKNRELLTNYVGIHSREVEKIAPWLGTAFVISRIRGAAGKVPSTGNPKPPK